MYDEEEPTEPDPFRKLHGRIDVADHPGGLGYRAVCRWPGCAYALTFGRALALQRLPELAAHASSHPWVTQNGGAAMKGANSEGSVTKA